MLPLVHTPSCSLWLPLFCHSVAIILQADEPHRRTRLIPPRGLLLVECSLQPPPFMSPFFCNFLCEALSFPVQGLRSDSTSDRKLIILRPLGTAPRRPCVCVSPQVHLSSDRSIAGSVDRPKSLRWIVRWLDRRLDWQACMRGCRWWLLLTRVCASSFCAPSFCAPSF